MCEARRLSFGLELELDKGIPLASGLGGSAASAVAAVVAANAVLPEPFSQLELLKFAMQGEQVASGSLHVDNIAASLYGGLVLTVGIDHPRVKQIPVPAGIRAVVVHPHMRLSTRSARAILRGSVPLEDFVWQTAHLAGFISACYTQRPRAAARVLRGRGDRAAARRPDSRLRRGAPGRDLRRRAGLLDRRRRADGVRLVPGRRTRWRCARRWSWSSRATS